MSFLLPSLPFSFPVLLYLVVFIEVTLGRDFTPGSITVRPPEFLLLPIMLKLRRCHDFIRRCAGLRLALLVLGSQ
jgi:hypothetical protein